MLKKLILSVIDLIVSLKLIHNPFQTPCPCSWLDVDVGQLSSVASRVSDLSPTQPLQECTSPVQQEPICLDWFIVLNIQQWTCKYHELLQLNIRTFCCKNENISNPLIFQNYCWIFTKQGQLLLFIS